MARLTQLPALDIINGFKGTIDFYVHRGIPCARSWPKSPGRIRSEAVMLQWPVFTIAAKLWAQTSEPLRQVYRDMAAETNLTPRDVQTKSFISGILSWYTPPADVNIEEP